MKYLNKNIEEIGKTLSTKSLINNSKTSTHFRSYENNASSLDDYIQSSHSN